MIKKKHISTPLGQMLAIADDHVLYGLGFVESDRFLYQMNALKSILRTQIISGENALIHSIENELQAYFLGKLQVFCTPIALTGSRFQQLVWTQLQTIPFSYTYSYLEVARAISYKTAYRAVANANGANPLAIIVPCHRVIQANGHLGGYAGGTMRKKGLIDHERKFI